MGAATKKSTAEYSVFQWVGQKNYPLTSSFVIGSDRADLLLGEDPGVSPRHCRIFLNDEGASVEDLGSEQGTWVNDCHLKKGDIAELNPGARVVVGRQTFTLIVKGGVPADLIRKKKAAPRLKLGARFLKFITRTKDNDEVTFENNSPSSGWTVRIFLMIVAALATHYGEKWNVMAILTETAKTTSGTGITPADSSASETKSYESLLGEAKNLTTKIERLSEGLLAGPPSRDSINLVKQQVIPEIDDLRARCAKLANASEPIGGRGRQLKYVLELHKKRLQHLLNYVETRRPDEFNEIAHIKKEILSRERGL